MTHNDQRTISDYGLLQHELEVQEVAPLFDEDEFAALFSFDPEEFEQILFSHLNEKDKTKVSYSMKDGLLLRTVHMIDRISDISPVVDPAFYGTDVTVRSMDDTIAELSGENKD